MASHFHNQRILRFLLVLSAVVLTIFVYASYSTNTPAYSPAATHSRNTPSAAVVAAAEALRQSRQNHTNLNEIEGKESYNNNNDIKSAGIGIRAAPNDLNESQHQQQQKHAKINRKSFASAVGNESQNFVKKQHKHREPTIDEVAVADSGGGVAVVGSGNDNNNDLEDVGDEERFMNNDLLEEQYVQNIDNALGNINNSNPAAGNIVAQSQNLNAQQQEQQVLADQIANNSNNNNKNNNIVNNNNNNNNNLNKILDSDVLIPTSNLQKFIENADKILKNMTVVNGGQQSDGVSGAGAAPGNNEDPLNQKLEEAKQLKNKILDSDIPVPKIDTGNNPENNLLDNSIETNDEALPPSVVMAIKRAGGGSTNIQNADNEEKQNNLKENLKPVEKIESNKIMKPDVKSSSTPKPTNVTTPHSPYDPSKGILTEHIYESGHLDSEINIEKLCPQQGVDIKLLILITSAPSHAEARLAIRQTWGHYGSRRDVSIAFMLGRTFNETLNLSLTKENFIYGDLIRGNFIDSYNNLTLKTISSLEWVDQHCSNAKYILKTDDDMFINVPKLLGFLDSHTKEKHVIFGRLAKKWKPIRNKKSKYYVSTDQFAAPIFPPFTTGPAYVLSQDTIHELYVRSLNQVYLKLEDVFTTGIVAQQLGIKRMHVNEFLNRRIAFNPCNIRKTISVHMIKANEQFDLWKKLLDQTTKCK